MGTPVWNSGWPMTEFSFAVRLSRGNFLWGRRLLAAERLVPIAGAGRGESRFGLAEIIIRLDLTETRRDRTPRCSDCNPQRQCQPFPGPSMHPSKGRGRASHSLLLKDSGLGSDSLPGQPLRSCTLRGTSLGLNLETEHQSPRFRGGQRGGKQLKRGEPMGFEAYRIYHRTVTIMTSKASQRSPAHSLCRHRPDRTMLKVSSRTKGASTCPEGRPETFRRGQDRSAGIVPPSSSRRG